MKRSFLSIFVIGAALAVASAQQSNDMRGMQMPGHDMSQMNNRDMSDMQSVDSETGAHAMRSMEGHHMDMGPHMKMTSLRASQPGDEKKAEEVLQSARTVMEKYRDYNTALNDGFKIFLPNIPQKQYHFTNYRYAMEAAYHFNPGHPTSLLYERHGDSYTLIGIMYTAPKRLNEDDLNERIPLSIAQWHEHVNFCAPPAAQKGEPLGPDPKFGLRGSITTQAECDAAGGTFHPVIFNWMVHVYPLEKDSAQIWSVERQGHHHDD